MTQKYSTDTFACYMHEGSCPVFVFNKFRRTVHVRSYRTNLVPVRTRSAPRARPRILRRV
eukprot:COSAG02_NODE_926_length_15856_cov_13.975566_24_plen_60_part_00